MKNFIIFICVIMLFIISSGCANQEIKNVRNLQIKDIDISSIPDGIYKGEYSYGSFTYIVQTDIQKGKIVYIKVIENRDTKHAKKAEGVIERVIDAQRVNVDAVTGATTTSKALLKAIENSLKATDN